MPFMLCLRNLCLFVTTKMICVLCRSVIQSDLSFCVVISMIEVHVFANGYAVVAIPFVENAFSTALPFHLCYKSVVHISVVLFLDSILSIDLFVSISVLHCLDYLSNCYFSTLFWLF